MTAREFWKNLEDSLPDDSGRPAYTSELPDDSGDYLPGMEPKENPQNMYAYKETVEHHHRIW